MNEVSEGATVFLQGEILDWRVSDGAVVSRHLG